MAETTAEQPFGARGRFITFVVHGLIMRGAPPLWCARRCCSQYKCRTVAVMRTLVEGRKAGAVDFLIGGRVGNAGEDLQGLDSIEWYGVYGPECTGGGDDVTTCEKKMRWLQLLKEVNCTVTSTSTNNDDNLEYHTWRA